jgi:hypothetical protein
LPEGAPEVFRGYFEPYLGNGQNLPYTVLIPSFEILGNRISEKLICSIDREIHILEKDGTTFTIRCYPMDGIRYVEVRTVLLDSYIKISGMTGQGVSASSILQYNSITDYLFTPILRTIRLGRTDGNDSVEQKESETFDEWMGSNYKFMNYARRSLLKEERVLHAILQPEIRKNAFTFLGRVFSRTVSPVHASILTDRELILIREELIQGRKDKYGGIWDYIPLNKITGLSLNTTEDGSLALSIHLSENECLEYLFQTSLKGEVDQLVERFNELTLKY